MNVGDLERADEDLAAAAVLYSGDELNLAANAAIVTHNRGLLAGRSGRYVQALRRFDEARQQLAALACPPGALESAEWEIYLSLGLADEIVPQLERLIAELEEQSAVGELAEAQLQASVALLHAGALEAAHRHALAARDAFRQQQRSGWPDAAELQLLRVAAARGEFGPGDATILRALATRLESAGQRTAADHAALLAAQTDLERDPAGVAAAAALIRVGRGYVAVEIALHALALEAEAGARAGRRADAQQAITAGCDLLERQHAALGAADVRASISVHATRLFDVARRLALSEHDAGDVFDAVEAGRANSLRHRVTARERDDVGDALLNDLRRTTASAVGPIGDPALEAERTRAEQAVTHHFRRVAGDDGTARATATVAGVRQALDGATMVVVAESDGQLAAVVVDGAARLVRLGEAAPVADIAAGLTQTLRRIARRPGPSAAADVAAARQLAAMLDERLLAPLDLAADDHVVVVPPARMHQTPWSLLPSFSGRAFTLAPSATAWLAAGQVATGDGPAVLVAGPRLEHAPDEVARLAAYHPRRPPLTGADATTSAVLDAMDGAGLVHIAAHYIARRGNAMLSAIEFDDGGLYLHQVVRLARPPRTIVLSTCNSAAAAVRPGDEVIGLGAALLQGGTHSVVATSSLLPDTPTTIEFVARVHTELADGRTPSVALREARRSFAGDDPVRLGVASSFVCIGRG